MNSLIRTAFLAAALVGGAGSAMAHGAAKTATSEAPPSSSPAVAAAPIDVTSVLTPRLTGGSGPSWTSEVPPAVASAGVPVGDDGIDVSSHRHHNRG
ncbi:hypothetical protein ACE7GA_17250 [Roseomonas sp. CCTCC AB2023176]|uniref:hypothetical protein n=1 Tax=Roseomonas sp. CCTCC AB2023176 TaxID=3342640 RepID=UPI0035D8524F